MWVSVYAQDLGAREVTQRERERGKSRGSRRARAGVAASIDPAAGGDSIQAALRARPRRRGVTSFYAGAEGCYIVKEDRGTRLFLFS